MDKRSIFLLLVILILSCQKEKIVAPDTGRKTVLNGLLETDQPLGVSLSSSLYIMDSLFVSSNFLRNASVVLYENDVFLDSLPYLYLNNEQSLNDFFLVPNNYVSKKFYPKPGAEYKIKINAPDKPEVTAITTIPNRVKIERIDSTREILSNVEYYKSNINMHFDITFTDPVNEKNYYVFYVFNGQHQSPIYEDITFQDPIIEETIDHGTARFGIAFSDRSINGHQHRISVVLNAKAIGLPFYNDNYPFHSNRTVLYFELYSIHEDYFKYIQTFNLFLKNYNNPLANPTQVFSNVQGGYGIFAGAAVSCDSIVFNYDPSNFKK